jgi:phenylpyruvate tautomerase PptA (4-oxalocrotonate tautomerase family)
MPLVRIDLNAGKPAQYRQAIGDIVYRAMLEVLKAPEDDKFQVLTEHPLGDLNVAKSYLGIEHTGEAVVIQITLNLGRSTEQKRVFYRRVADDLHAQLGLRREDVIISLVETGKENWSFGNGEAPYATA